MNEQSRSNDHAAPVVRSKTIWVMLIILMGLVIVVADPVLHPRRGSYHGQIPAATIQISVFGVAIEAFRSDNGYFPPGTNGLLYLMQSPTGATNWQGPYLERPVPKDPWGYDYIYECPGRHNPQSYDLSSMGPDGRIGGGDDISNWTKP